MSSEESIFTLSVDKPFMPSIESQRAIDRLSEVVELLSKHGLDTKNINLDNITINVEPKHKSQVDITGDKVEMKLNETDIRERPSVFDHEIGHTIHYLANGSRIDQTKLLLPAYGAEDNFQNTYDFMYLRGLDETLAFMTEFTFAEDVKDTNLQYIIESELESLEDEPAGFKERIASALGLKNSQFSAFDIYYTSPRHALGMTIARRIYETEPNQEQRLKILASLIGQPLEKTADFAKKVFGREHSALMKRFSEAVKDYREN